MSWYPEVKTLNGTATLTVAAGAARGLALSVLTGSVSVQVGTDSAVTFAAGSVLELRGDSVGDNICRSVVLTGLSSDTTARVVTSVGA